MDNKNNAPETMQEELMTVTEATEETVVAGKTKRKLNIVVRMEVRRG